MEATVKSIATASHEITAADELFVNLDRAILTTDRGSWSIEVCGVHQLNSHYWLQLSLIGPDPHSVTLRTESLDLASIRRQLTDWLDSSHALEAVRRTAA